MPVLSINFHEGKVLSLKPFLSFLAVDGTKVQIINRNKISNVVSMSFYAINEFLVAYTFQKTLDNCKPLMFDKVLISYPKYMISELSPH